MSPFEELGLSPFFSSCLGERNIHRPTDIQVRVIPELLRGRSLAFRSATGTGKTFAYLLPLFQRFFPTGPLARGLRPEVPGAAGLSPVILILAPTYELCSQIKGEADFLLRDSPLRASLLIGSANISRQIEGLKKEKPVVVVGNPGRILLLAGMGKFKFDALRSLVLDEGDRFAADDLRGETLELLERIARSPSRPDLVGIACSATLSAKSLGALLPFMGENLELIESDEREILRERIQHWAVWAESRRKAETLRSFLAAAKPGKALVFTGRSRDAEHIAFRLGGGLSAAALYSGMEKNRRRDAVGAFRLGKLRILVSSDLAARGLDIPDITHVIALDVPDNVEAYTHRAGRTGRAGKRGIMVSIGDEVEMRRLALIEKRLGLMVYPKEIYRGRILAPAEEGGSEAGPV
jgi:superfamily II DNA/RNA helicase